MSADKLELTEAELRSDTYIGPKFESKKRFGEQMNELFKDEWNESESLSMKMFNKIRADELVSLVRAGNTLNCACKCIGVNPKTAWNWTKRGLKDRQRRLRGEIDHITDYEKLAYDIRDAEGEFEAKILNQVVDLSTQAGYSYYNTWLLERRFGDEWTSVKKQEIDFGTDKEAVQIEFKFKGERDRPENELEYIDKNMSSLRGQWGEDDALQQEGAERIAYDKDKEKTI